MMVRVLIVALALLVTACIWEGPQPADPPGATILNATDEPITVFFRSMSGMPAIPRQVDPREQRDVATVGPDECAGEDSSHASRAVYRLAAEDELPGTDNETAMTTEPDFEMDLLDNPMCDGDIWIWDGRSLQPPDR